MKLPTTFQELDLTGFTIETKQYNSITKEMINIACAVLQKNGIGIVTRSLQSALKYIYGIGGSADTVCKLLREWRTNHQATCVERSRNIKQSEQDFISTLLQTVDDGVLDDSDIPTDYLTAMNQWAIAIYKLAYQSADTTVSGERTKYLITENELLKQQLTGFPQLQLELNFYKSECERQRNELKEAYINLNQQKLIESEEFKNKWDNLILKNNELSRRLAELEESTTNNSKVTILS